MSLGFRMKDGGKKSRIIIMNKTNLSVRIKMKKKSKPLNCSTSRQATWIKTIFKITKIKVMTVMDLKPLKIRLKNFLLYPKNKEKKL